MKTKDYLQLVRPQQYLKNFFIFLPLFFALKATEAALLLKAFWAFLVFCLVASVVYIFNDYFDRTWDRLHPIKRNRPLASGRVTPREAFILAGLLLAVALILGIWFLDYQTLLLIAVYCLLNLVYTLRLKHVAIVDIATIAIGFVLRVFVGSTATSVPLSHWIVVMTFLLALFLALAKRRDDVLLSRHNSQEMRKSVVGYNLEFLNTSMVIMASVVLVSYVMYTVSPEITMKTGHQYLYLTSFFVVLGLLRYLQNIFVKEKVGSPTEALVGDKFLQLVILGWILSFAFLIYRW